MDKYLSKGYIAKYINSLPIHCPDLYKQIGICDAIKCPEFVDDVYRLFVELSSLGFCAKRNYQPFIDCCIMGYLKGEVSLFSMCSHALTSDPHKFREKKQNRKIRKIREYLENMDPFRVLKINYFCILPDIDDRYLGEQYRQSWIENKCIIKKETGAETYLLSQICEDQYNAVLNTLAEYVDMLDMEKEIEYYEGKRKSSLRFEYLSAMCYNLRIVTESLSCCLRLSVIWRLCT